MSQLTFDDDGGRRDTLAEARAELQANLDDGMYCPCCTQWAKRYRWTMPGTAARFLIRAYRAGGIEHYVESKRIKRVGEQAMPSIAAFWALLEHESDRRPDGGRSGWWRVTQAGENFIRGGTIPKYAYVYDGAVQWHDGPPQTIADRLGFAFNWREHMNWTDL